MMTANEKPGAGTSGFFYSHFEMVGLKTIG